MDDDALDQLLQHAAPPNAAPIDDGMLLAYRDAALSASDMAAVEGLLARSAEARAMLRALAAADDAPVDEVAEQRMLRAKPRRAGLMVGGALLAIAAAVLVFVLRPDASATPTFEIVASSGVRVTRDPAVPLDAVYLPDSPVRVVLRPTATDAKRPAVRAWIKHKDEARPIAEPLRAVGTAAWALEVPARALFPRVGRYTLHFGLAADDAAIEGLRDARPGVQWLSLDVEYRVEPP